MAAAVRSQDFLQLSDYWLKLMFIYLFISSTVDPGHFSTLIKISATRMFALSHFNNLILIDLLFI